MAAITSIDETNMTEDPSQQSALEAEYSTMRDQAKELMRDQRYAEALDLFSAFIDKHPDFQKAYAYRAYVYHVSGELARAIQDYTTFIEFDPVVNGEYGNRGLIHYQAGDYEAALEDFNRAIERHPGGGSERILYSKGVIHEMREEVDLALDAYVKAFRKGVPAINAGEIQEYILKHTGMHFGDYLKTLRDKS
jgi:tetratricopeptide (TPR) repeat protein